MADVTLRDGDDFSLYGSSQYGEAVYGPYFIIGATEARGINNNIGNRTDSGTVSRTEAHTRTATMALGESDQVMVSESFSITAATVTRFDLGTVNETETRTIATSLPQADTGNVGSSEFVSLSGATTRSDTHQLFLMVNSQAWRTATDTPLNDTPLLSDTPNILVDITSEPVGETGQVIGSDTLTHVGNATVSETRQIIASDSLATVGLYDSTDAGEVNSTDEQSISADLQDSDTSTVGAEESILVFLTSSSVTYTDSGVAAAVDNYEEDREGSLSRSDSQQLATVEEVSIEGVSDNDIDYVVASLHQLSATSEVSHELTYAIDALEQSAILVDADGEFDGDTGRVESSETFSMTGTTTFEDMTVVGSILSQNSANFNPLDDNGVAYATESYDELRSMLLIDAAAISSGVSWGQVSAATFSDARFILSSEGRVILSTVSLTDMYQINASESWASSLTQSVSLGDYVLLGLEENISLSVARGLTDSGVVSHTGEFSNEAVTSWSRVYQITVTETILITSEHAYADSGALDSTESSDVVYSTSMTGLDGTIATGYEVINILTQNVVITDPDEEATTIFLYRRDSFPFLSKLRPVGLMRHDVDLPFLVKLRHVKLRRGDSIPFLRKLGRLDDR